MSLSETNRESLHKIESCLFTLSLDDYTYRSTESDSGEQTRSLAGHIRNISSGIDSTNRWFDKSMSLIVESNSRFGMMGEHSPVDALIPSIIADYAISEPIEESQFSPNATPILSSLERLDWTADAHVGFECEAARARSLAIINDSDPNVLRFDDYGIQWIKETGERHMLSDLLYSLGIPLTSLLYQLRSRPMRTCKWLCSLPGTNLSVHLQQRTKQHPQDYFFMAVRRLSEP